MTAQELEHLYSRWTGLLHKWVAEKLERHIDCEFFPPEWTFKIYSGEARIGNLDIYAMSTVPRILRPTLERVAIAKLPRPEDNPTQEMLDDAFRELCWSAARVLEIDLEKPKLAKPAPPKLKSKGGRRSKKGKPPVDPDVA